MTKTTLKVLAIFITTASGALAQDFSAKEVARCAGYNMARSEVAAETDPRQAARNKGEALAYSTAAMRMGFKKGPLLSYIHHERQIWHSQMMAFHETQDPHSADLLQQMSGLCANIRQELPELERYR